MYLKTLEIQGFKSFPERIEIAFQKGITAIVGPNGSGKSNVADAMRWVMGEQSAKQLRGSRMEDVIFGGTDNRRPLSFCEVTLTLDNADDALGVGFAEVAVTRRLYRSGESEYYINKTACRLKDVLDLFRDTGAGREGYSVIGQGRIDEILSNRAEDRRAVFEEAAGIAKYKTRKVEAERKLQHTADNLSRVDDLLGELCAQLEPLRDQAEKAKTYLSLRDALRGLEINQFLYQHEHLQQRAQTLGQQLEEMEMRRDQLAREGEALQKRAEQDAARLEETEQRAQQLREELAARTHEVEALQADIRVLEERLHHLDADIAREQAGMEDATRAREQACLALEQAQEEVQHKKQLREQARQELRETEEKLSALADTIALQEQEMERAKGRMLDAMNRMADLKARASHLEALHTATSQRMEEMRQLAHGAQLRHTQSHGEAEAAQQAVVDLKRQEAGALEEAARAQDEAERQGQRAQVLRQQRQRDAEDLQALQSRVRVLEDLKRDYEGYQSSVRNLLRDCAREESLKSRVRGVVAEAIRVPQRLEVAIEMALGAAAQNVITPTENDAKALIEHLRRHQYGRVTFLPMTSVRGRQLSAQERGYLNLAGVVGVASECVSFDPAYEAVVQNLLGRTVLVENMECGIQLSRRAGYAFRVVTLAGDMLNVGGSMTGGSVQSRVGALFGRERELAQAKNRMREIRAAIEKREEEIVLAAQAFQQKQQQEQACLQKLQDIRTELSRTLERAGILEETAKGRAERVAEYNREVERLQDTLQDIAAETAEIASLIEQAEHGNRQDAQQVDGGQADFARLKEQLSALQNQATALRVALAEREAQSDALVRDAERLRADQKRMMEDASQRLEHTLQVRAQHDHDAASLQHSKARLAGLEGALAQTREALAQTEKQREEAFAAYRQGEGLRQQQAADSAECLQRIARTESQLERAQADREALCARIFEEYSLTYADALPWREESFNPQEAGREITRMRGEIRQLGTVNVNAVEDCAVLEERVESLSSQREDLTRAAEDLSKLISGLEGRMAAQFKQAFAEINAAFQVTFKKLFGGGHAHLELMDASDVLQSGIEIVAQPPGTKLKSLTLLSGGQRALTAIALLFAMIEIRPTPFCVLDEIEAALDEANVAHYASALRGYTSDTQFVVITHRKGTMEACDALYGISMQEKGVSSMVSVRMTEGETA
nr:chromosome segregation protein SMC [bacterium]